MRTIINIGWLITLLICLTGCSNGNTRKHVIGVSQCSEDAWREKLNRELKTGEYLCDSIEIRLASANDDNKKQIQQINQFIDERVDLLIVSPNQLNTISSAIERAYDKGIPVILYDRKVSSERYTAFIGCDNYVVGQSMARFIAQQTKGKGRIAEIQGLEGSSPAMDRHRGFVDALKAYPGMALVASAAGNWKEDGGKKAMKQILKQTQDFDYVFCHNDRMAAGARLTAIQAGLNRYKYTGVDGLAVKEGGLEAVCNGTLEATYLYPTRGEEVLALAKDILYGRPYLHDNYLQSSIITKDNAPLTLMEARESDRQQYNLVSLHGQVSRYLSDVKTQKVLTAALLIMLFVIGLATAFIYRAYLIKIRLSEQLGKKNEELHQLNKEVLELTNSRLVFFTNISHELRTPLTLIADPVEMLLDDKNITGKSRRLLQMVQRNAVALQQLVGSILDFRKIQNGKMNLKLSRFDLVAALNTWMGDFYLTASRKQIDLTLDTSSCAGSLDITADKEQVARIMFNLLSNALKYTPAGGRIEVILRPTDNQHFQLVVGDTGKGLTHAEAALVFERFYQAQGATGGTGIGLALVKSFVELHHGTIHVESEPQQGARFIVEMPCTQEGDVDNGQAPSTTPAMADAADNETNTKGHNIQRVVDGNSDKPTILVIDDNADVRQYVHTILQSDYFVMEAADGQEGWEMAQKEVPDLVVCDVMMPRMDGLQFTQLLKSTTATSHIPIILLTAKIQERHRIDGYEHGADSYITKPFHSKVLTARIENLLKQRQMLKKTFMADNAAAQEIDKAALNSRDKQFVLRLHEIIQANLGNSDFSVEDIGQEIGLSRVQLYRKVKALTNSSVVDLLRKSRLAKAQQLLATNSMNVSEVAYAVGFSSPSYFTKCFKEEYDMLPGDMSRS